MLQYDRTQNINTNCHPLMIDGAPDSQMWLADRGDCPHTEFYA